MLKVKRYLINKTKMFELFNHNQNGTSMTGFAVSQLVMPKQPQDSDT